KAARDTQNKASDLDNLASLKETFVDIASDTGMFGSVPGGDTAEQALAKAAREMLEKLAKAGVSVENVVNNSGEVADIANVTDEEAKLWNRLSAENREAAHGADQKTVE